MPFQPARRSPIAVDPSASRGRRHAEPESRSRSPFQRDRDRILHSAAFRRLTHKTQVFVAHEGDHYRTRLTHTLEVAQIARTVARAFGLDEDIAEAVSLAHDLGHTPFGHEGEDVLGACLATHGGFDHNAQSFRIVTRLERRYAAFDGLNLTWETLEGIVKHNGPLVDDAGRPVGRYAAKGLPHALLDHGEAVGGDLRLATRASAEAQVAAIADDIAYDAHDIDDGVRSGLITLEQLEGVALFEEHYFSTVREFPQLQGRRVLYESIRRMLSAQVYDVIDATRTAISAAAPATADDARRCAPLVKFSEAMASRSAGLKAFLLHNLYRHPQVLATTGQAKDVVRELFGAYVLQPAQMPPDFAARPNVPRAVADYIAGMTDRFAAREHERLTGRRLLA